MGLRLFRAALLVLTFTVACSPPAVVPDAGSGGGSGGGTGGGAGGGTGGGTGGGGGGGGGGSSLPTLADFCVRAAAEACAHVRGCGQLGLLQVPDCEAQVRAACEPKVRAVDAGSLAFDPVTAGDCLDSARAAPCYGGYEDFGDCVYEAFEHAGAVGAPCTGRECVDGYCPPGPAESCRACAAFAGQGQSCAHPNACNPTQGFCPPAPTDGGARVCEPLRSPGAACQTSLECAGRASCVSFAALDGGVSRCGPIGIGEPCALATDCGPTAYCKGLRIAAHGGVSPGTCAARLAPNATCINEQYDDGCQGTRATCLGGKCVTAAAHSRPLSAECDSYDQCPAGSYCTCAGPIAEDGGISVRDGNCLSQQGDGGGCWEEPDYSMCLPGLACIYPQRLCEPLRAEGQTCGNGAGLCSGLLTCTSELTPGQGRCVALRTPGQSCTGLTLPCQPSGFCALDAGVCSGRLGTDGGCAGHDQCQSNRCLDGDGGKFCAPACR